MQNETATAQPETRLLQAGDFIYVTGYGTEISDRIEIERVTNTTAIAGNKKFRRDISSYGTVKIIGANTWLRNIFRVETEELKEKYFLQGMISKIKSIKWEGLRSDQIEAVFNIVKTVGTL